MFFRLKIRALTRVPTRRSAHPLRKPDHPADPLLHHWPFDLLIWSWPLDQITLIPNSLTHFFFRIFVYEKFPKKFLKIQEYKRIFFVKEKVQEVIFLISVDLDTNSISCLPSLTNLKFVQLGIFYSFICLLIFMLYFHHHHIYYSFK